MTLKAAKFHEAGPGRSTTARGAATREALLDSTIRLIASTGFAATSTQAVLDDTGISRGSLLHHFPTRQHLMKAAAEEALHRNAHRIEMELSGIPDPVEAWRGFPAVLWRTQQEPPARALAELLLAARWDHGLDKGIRELLERWNDRIRQRVRNIAVLIGVDNADELAAEFSVLIAAVRGLALYGDFLGEAPTVERTLAALSQRYEASLPRGVDPTRS